MTIQWPTTITIAGRRIGPEEPPYVVAEISANHCGDSRKALELIRAAKAAGADAVKIQCFTPEMMTIESADEDFILRQGPWKEKRLWDLYSDAATPLEWTGLLIGEAVKMRIPLFASPFAPSAVAHLEQFGCPAYKIASPECTDLELIAAAAATGKPLIFSTGLVNLDQIFAALDCARANGAKQVALLHCVSSYPARPELMNFRRITALRDAFHCPVGLSDHSNSAYIPALAIPLGASIIEKHLMLMTDRDVALDSSFSLMPPEFDLMARNIREAYTVSGVWGFDVPEESDPAYARSLYVVKPIRQGEAFTGENLRAIRPGYGFSPLLRPYILGSTARYAIKAGARFTWSMIADATD